MNPIYEKLAADFDALGDYGYCAPLAVSALTGISAADSQRLFANRGRRLRGGSTHAMICAVLNDLGIQYAVETPDSKTVSNIQGSELVGKHLLINVTRKSGHAIACRDGEILDWTAGTRKTIYLKFRFLNDLDNSEFSDRLENLDLNPVSPAIPENSNDRKWPKRVINFKRRPRPGTKRALIWNWLDDNHDDVCKYSDSIHCCKLFAIDCHMHYDWDLDHAFRATCREINLYLKHIGIR